MELSQKVDTDNLFEKAAMGAIVLGAGLELGQIYTHLIEFGAALYFSTIAYKGCMAKHDRRKADHTPKRRKILS
jgi:hypothetical protein